MRYLFIIFLITQFLFLNPIKSTSVASADDSWKNFYGIAWRSGGANIPKDVKYAKQMGYPSIVIKGDWTGAYRNNPDLVGLKFFLMTPDLYVPVFSNHAYYIDTTLTYSQSDKDFYNKNMVWKSNDAFPNNLASGWFDSATRFQIHWDYQQQVVIDAVIERIIAFAKSMEDKANNFTCGGWMIDVPKLKGDWHYWDTSQHSTTLARWNAGDTGITHDAITHEYATYSEGVAAFYKKLNARMKLEFPNSKWIIDPYNIYNTSLDSDEWVYQIKDRADKVESTPDMIIQESAGTQFVTDTNILNSGMNITLDMVGNGQRNSVTAGTNTAISANAAMNGAWYNWFGQWGIGVGGSSDMPNFQLITEVYPRLKLIRCIPNWDNLNNVPLADRSWNGSVYQSTKGYISSDVMYSEQPSTGKIFAVFTTIAGKVILPVGRTVATAQSTDGYFIESGNAIADFDVVNNVIDIKDSVSVPAEGLGYIFTTTYISEGKTASSVVSSGKTLTGIVSAGKTAVSH